MVGSRLQWGRERQLSRVKLNLTCNLCREVCKTMAWHWLGGATNAQGEFARRAMTQATLLCISKGYNRIHKLCMGEIAKTTDAQQSTT
jgi:hypothetical protein